MSRAYILRVTFLNILLKYSQSTLLTSFSPPPGLLRYDYNITLYKCKVKAYFGMEEAIWWFQVARFITLNSCCAIERQEEEHEKLQYKKNTDTMLVRTQYGGKHFFVPLSMQILLLKKTHIKLCLDFCLCFKNICKKRV